MYLKKNANSQIAGSRVLNMPMRSSLSVLFKYLITICFICQLLRWPVKISPDDYRFFTLDMYFWHTLGTYQYSIALSSR